MKYKLKQIDMAKKVIIEAPQTTEADVVKGKPFQKKRLSNAAIVEKTQALIEDIDRERNIRRQPSEVIDREGPFHLEGLIMKLKGLLVSFQVFIAPPKAR